MIIASQEHRLACPRMAAIGPILLKNFFFTNDGKILGVIRREVRFRLGGYMKELSRDVGRPEPL